MKKQPQPAVSAPCCCWSSCSTRRATAVVPVLTVQPVQLYEYSLARAVLRTRKRVPVGLYSYCSYSSYVLLLCSMSSMCLAAAACLLAAGPQRSTNTRSRASSALLFVAAAPRCCGSTRPLGCAGHCHCQRYHLLSALDSRWRRATGHGSGQRHRSALPCAGRGIPVATR